MAKRNFTDDERKAWEEKREAFKELVKRVAALTDDERQAFAAKVPVTTVEGHTLSIRNQCIAAMQCEGVSLVGGFRQWKNQERHVMKGEKAIWILAPSPYKDDDGEEHMSFRHVAVFDISQTAPITETVDA